MSQVLTRPVLSMETDQPLVIAHRGNSSTAPENTLVALESAWRAGADMIEVDLQRTRDGVAVVRHDASLERTTDGVGSLENLDAADLAILDAGAWFSESYRGQRVPTATELLGFFVNRPDIGLLGELKGRWDVAHLRPLTDAIVAAGLADRVILQSFEVETVAALAEAAPDLRRGLLIEEEWGDVLTLCRDLGVVTCNPDVELLAQAPGIGADLDAIGVRMMPWTLNTPAQWRAAVAAGVDGVITDRPDRLRGWIDAHLPE